MNGEGGPRVATETANWAAKPLATSQFNTGAVLASKCKVAIDRARLFCLGFEAEAVAA